MPLADGTESGEVTRTLRMNQAQQQYLDHRFQRGETLLRLGNRYPEPILATFPPPTTQKAVTAEQWATAIARVAKHLPTTTYETKTPPRTGAIGQHPSGDSDGDDDE